MTTRRTAGLLTLLVAGLVGCAQHGMMKHEGAQGMGGMASHMAMIDNNNDGFVSKEEFMKHHEAMFDKMKKDSNGMVSLKDMQAMHDRMKQ